jgi:hypothetical protein
MSLNLKASIAASIAFIFSVPFTAAALFFPVVFFAGPHSSVLPGFAQKIALAIAWLAVVLIPLYLSSRTYKWYLKRHV